MFPRESTAIMWRPNHWPPFSPILPIGPTTLPASQLRNQIGLLVRSENEAELVRPVRREADAARGAALAGGGAMMNSFTNVPSLLMT
jgi:hypothetical protein